MKIKTILMMAILCGLAPGMEEPRLFRDDPVALAEGRTLMGKNDLRAAHGGITYLFADAANLNTFIKNPERYAVSMGGACARMGPLSGKGRLDLYTVHHNKLYIFGSEGCRTIFLEDPERAFDPDRTPGTGGDAKTGAAWIEKLVRAMGGKALDASSEFTRSFREEVERRGETQIHHRMDKVVFPHKYTFESDWNDRKFHRFLDGEKGWFDGVEGKWSMAPVQVRAMNREFLAIPLVLLKARNQPGFSARSLGEETLNGQQAVVVAVNFENMEQTLLINKESGLLMAQRYRGRGSDSLFAPMEKRFSEYEKAGSLLLPAVVDFSSDGTVWKTERWQYEVK